MSVAVMSALTGNLKRMFHNTACVLLRRRGPQRKEERTEFDDLLDSPPSFFHDVPSVYQQSLIKEAVLVRSYLEKVKTELPLLTETLEPIPYSATPVTHLLRFRRIRIYGDPLHPLHAKAVLTVSIPTLVTQATLTPSQTHYLKKLLRSRYDPTSEQLKMSCERFPHYAQNKKWLGDTLNTLLDNVKSATDLFEDIPLDLAHAAKKVKRINKAARLKFPEEWLKISQKTEMSEKNNSGSNA